MREYNGIMYFTTGDTANFCGKSLQTIKLYQRYSKQSDERHNRRLVPPPDLIVNGRQLYTKETMKAFYEVISKFKRGQLNEYTSERAQLKNSKKEGV
jgi:hypothetical protein